MKKNLFALFFASTLLLGACGEETVSTEETQSDDTEEVETVNAEEEIEETEDVENDKEIVLGQPMQIGEYTMTVTDFSLGVDYDGNDALIIEYDWENNSDESASPFMTFIFKGFQDNAETDDVFMVDGIELESSQKEYKPEGKVEGAHDAIGINDMNLPLILELEELMSFDDDVYTTTIDLSELE